MTNPADEQLPPEGVAFDWVSRILAVSAEMVLPGLGGQWLDRRWGTNYLALLGFALGVTLGIWHLIVMTSHLNKRGKPGSSPRPPEDSAK